MEQDAISETQTLKKDDTASLNLFMLSEAE